jgi:hypothetical protein
MMLRFDCNLVRMAIIKKTSNAGNTGWRRSSSTPLMGIYMRAAAVQISAEVPKKLVLESNSWLGPLTNLNPETKSLGLSCFVCCLVFGYSG